MSAELEKARAKYSGIQDAARLAASKTMREQYGLDVRLMQWSNRAAEQHRLWKNRRVNWDWSEVFRRNREPKCFSIAMWAPGNPDRLFGVALVTITPSFVTLRFVEGDPNDGCEFKGKRALLALEAMTNYAQACGVGELRIEPLNEALGSLYEDTYGFELVKSAKEAPYYRKRI